MNYTSDIIAVSRGQSDPQTQKEHSTLNVTVVGAQSTLLLSDPILEQLKELILSTRTE